MSAHNLYTIPAGVPFLSTMVKSLLSGKLIDGFSYDQTSPHELSKVRIFVPTRRAVRALRSEFVDQIGLGSVILPDIRPLGEAEEDLGFFDGGAHDSVHDAALAEFPKAEPISRTQSKLILAELILAWKKALPKAFSEQFEAVPIVAPASPADALWMAEDLLALIESAESEEVDLSKLDDIDAQDHANWWQLTLEFLKILREYWPARLKELSRQSSIIYRIAMLDQQTQYIEQNDHDGPMIVAGSTGSLPATARLINVVSKKRQGAVILPGLDQNMDVTQWSTIFAAADQDNKNPDYNKERPKDHLASVVLQGHPQYGLARLFNRMGLGAHDIANVKELLISKNQRKTRQELISKAMLPAELTASWASTENNDNQNSEEAIDGLTLIEAKNEYEEVAAITAAIRLAIEPANDTKEPTVALVTPDRNLARRVSIALNKYALEANDSGGQSLDQTPIGSLITLTLNWICKNGDNADLIALLKHPYAQFGHEKSIRDQHTSLIERLVLRRSKHVIKPLELPDLLKAKFEGLGQDKHVPNWLKAITETDYNGAIEFAHKFATAFSLLDMVDDEMQSISQNNMDPISVWVEKTINLLELMTMSSDQTYDIWDDEAGKTIIHIFEEIRQCDVDFSVSASEWADMVAPIFSGQTVKPQSGTHPNVMIWGTLEARMQNVDTIILAGLNEGTWPGTGGNDPFLSRSMKSQIGLEPPERRIGLAAHDFQMAMGLQNVVLSRSLKSNGAPTVASRWLQRVVTILNDASVQTIKARGQDLISYMRMTPDPSRSNAASRPNPKPAARYQPNSYSFSEVGTLRRDPYAIYARRILRLDMMEDFTSEPDLRDRGTIYHAVLEEFSTHIDANFDQNNSKHLIGLLDQHLKAHNLPLPIALLWRERFKKVAAHFVAWENARAHDIKGLHIELSARTPLPIVGLPIKGDMFLTGRADRIDLLQNGSAEIIDFKTGTSPSAKEARTLLDPQLPLEAYALTKGGFKSLGHINVQSLKYVRLKPSDRLIVDQVEEKASNSNPDPASPVELGEQAVAQLCSFLKALQVGEAGFISRAIPKLERDYSGDYDHLARVSEWSVSEPTNNEQSDD